jgi:alpha-tubulin suppressor-like RCC1 family protein
MTTSRFFAMRVAAIADPVVSLAGGCHRHFCAATALGDVWCWGENQHGELGTGFASQLESTPAHVAGVPSAVQVTVGAFHSCARTTAGEVWCWGDNTNGQLGDGSFEASFTPVRVAGITGTPIDLEASCSDTFVLRDDKSLLAWGAAVQLGTGDTLNSPEPVEVAMPCP